MDLTAKDIADFQNSKPRTPVGRGNSLGGRISPEAKELGGKIARGIVELNPVGAVLSVGQQIATGEKDVTDALEMMSEAVLGKIGGPIKVARNVIAGRKATGYREALKEGKVFTKGDPSKPNAGSVDEKPRFEIYDVDAKVNENVFTKVTPSIPGAASKYVYKGNLGNLLNHPELYKNYPHLKDYNVDLTVDVNAKHSRTGRHVYDKKLIQGEAKSNEKARLLLVHEIQHAIQEYEGHAKGGSGKDIDDMLARIYPQYQVKVDPKVQAWLPTDVKNVEDVKEVVALGYSPAQLSESYLKYLHIAGEAEARLAEARAQMTIQELIKTPAWQQELDVPKDKLIRIFRRDDIPSLD